MGARVDIGTDDSGAPVEVNLEELLASRLLVQGNSGSGKSHLLRRLLEGSASQVQQIVIDPEGDFVSLAVHLAELEVRHQRAQLRRDRSISSIRGTTTKLWPPRLSPEASGADQLGRRGSESGLSYVGVGTLDGYRSAIPRPTSVALGE